MTATFGKLEHETLTLKPGLNIIHAPNEWGKSTWCAFLVAMLYGIDTRAHSTKTALADKERYAPWSGSPMSGRIDLHWEGKDITIERSTKGRSVFGVFRAYETATGLEIPQLRSDNCGQLLLGVEKSVFQRAGFLRLTDLPVTQDESLRRRLNALVTTGDESGTADTLAQKLRDLKNRCRANRASGLLPQAEGQRAQLEEKLEALRQLQAQSGKLLQRQKELEIYQKQLMNHQAALEYEKDRAYAAKLEEAQAYAAQTRIQLEEAQAKCQGLPEADAAETMLLRLDQLQSAMNVLQMDAQLLPEMPKAPTLVEAFRDAKTVDIRQFAATDEAVYAQAVKEKDRKLPTVLGIVIAVISLALVLLPHPIGLLLAALGCAAGIIVASANMAARKRAANTAHALEDRYRPLRPGTWVQEAEAALDALGRYEADCAAYETERSAIARRARELQEEAEALTGGEPLTQYRRRILEARDCHIALSEARKAHFRAQQLAQTLRGTQKAVAPIPLRDPLRHTASETARLLSDCSLEQRQLHERLGHCRAEMEALGTEEQLTRQLAAINARIAELEDTYAALEIAQQTLAQARAQLQRRFAPQISRRAQELFGELTLGRYTRLTLAEDLSVQAGAQEEDTLRGALWRSDGTADQLYLALRLAVSEALTPNAPLVLDDALARFDDQRLARALAVLERAAEHKQVILFSCQKREQLLAAERSAAT